jgi:SsrA-binding protein
MAAARPARSEDDAGIRTVATNRRARHEYHVIETFEAGLELRGTEVKSLRAGEVSLAESFGVVEGGQVYLDGLHIQPYRFGNVHNHDPRRRKRLLLHAPEIRRIYGQVSVKGQALVPLRIYFRKGRAKAEIAIGRGKHFEDKRETLKRRTADREAERALAGARRA